MQRKWAPKSWRGMPIRQVPEYPDAAALRAVEATLRDYPPLVFAGEARSLKARLARVVEGQAFLLQGGDCAESFEEFHPEQYPRHLPGPPADGGGADLRRRVSGGEGRAHGRAVRQAAHLGHRDPERRHAALLSRRHHQRHGVHAGIRAPRSAAHDPAFSQSAATLNLLRAFAQGGYADLHRVHSWTQGFVADSPQGERYREIADRLTETLDFMAACGLTSETTPQIRETDLYTSHEALLLAIRAGADPRRFAPPATGTTSRPTCCGSATAPASPTARMSNSCAASRTRSASNAGRASIRPTC